MANRAVTIGIPHGEGKPVVLTGPEVTFTEHKDALKKIQGEKTHERFERIEIWTSGQGLIKRKKFLRPDPKPAATTKKVDGDDDTQKSDKDHEDKKEPKGKK